MGNARAGQRVMAENAGRCTAVCCGSCDGPGRRFYVTVVRGERTGFLAGPFETHQAALDMVPAARRVANEVDPRTAFDGFGTVSMEPGPWPAGVLNANVGMEV